MSRAFQKIFRFFSLPFSSREEKGSKEKRSNGTFARFRLPLVPPCFLFRMKRKQTKEKGSAANGLVRPHNVLCSPDSEFCSYI